MKTFGSRLVEVGVLGAVVLAACGGGAASPGGGDDTMIDASAGGGGGGGDGSGDGPGAGSGTAAACTGLTAQPLDATWMVGGREVRVHVPASYDPAKRTPVVVNLHGWASDGPDQATLSHMIAKSDAAGFIAVHPSGHDSPRGWNAGVCCGAAATSGVDDVAWINAVLDELEAKLCVDADRVFATGLSNGAFMAHRLGCEDADRFAAIAPVAGVVGTPACNPSRPVAVMHVHGTSDPVIPYTGGGVNGNESVATTIGRWVANDHCTGATTTTYTNGDATCVTHAGCAGGTDVVLCTIDGGGHQWPGGDSIGSLVGKKSDDLIATDAMWTFFAAHPRQVTTP